MQSPRSLGCSLSSRCIWRGLPYLLTPAPRPCWSSRRSLWQFFWGYSSPWDSALATGNSSPLSGPPSAATSADPSRGVPELRCEEWAQRDHSVLGYASHRDEYHYIFKQLNQECREE